MGERRRRGIPLTIWLGNDDLAHSDVPADRCDARPPSIDPWSRGGGDAATAVVTVEKRGGGARFRFTMPPKKIKNRILFPLACRRRRRRGS